MRLCSYWLRVLVCASLLATVDAQAPTATPDLPTDWAAVHELLEPVAAEDDAHEREPPSRNTQLAIVRAFLARWKARAPATAPEIVDARLRLASLLLAGLECEAAAAAFQTVLDAAPDEALDLRGRAMYGVAQAHLLADRISEGTALLERLHRELLGTRWADHAEIALSLLEPTNVRASRVGEPAPEIGPRLDRTGRSLSLAGLRGEPVLLVFLAPLDDVAFLTARDWLSAARRAGLLAERCLVFAIDADVAAIDARRPLRELPAVLLPTSAGFLDPTLLRYRVDAVPTSVLIGPDGTLLARDLPARRLERAITELLR